MDSSPKGGKAPYGYKWHKGELIIVDQEAIVVYEIFKLFLIHQRKRTVAKLLNEKGFRTRAGKIFQYSTVSRLLSNPTMMGVHRYSVTQKNSGQHSTIESSVPAIISPAQWEQTNNIIRSFAGKQTRKPAQDVFVGKVYCTCQKPMEILSKSSNYSCHKCKFQIAIEDVHAIFESEIKRISFPDKEILAGYLEKNKKNSKSALQSKLLKTHGDIEKLFELHSDDAISTTVFKQRHEQLTAQENTLKQKLDAHKEKILPHYNTLYDFWKTLNNTYKFTFVDTLVYRITFNANVASLSLYPLFNFAQQGSDVPRQHKLDSLG